MLADSSIACWESGEVEKLTMVKVQFNSLWLKQNGRHFADDIFNCIFLNETAWIWIKISLKFVILGSVDNIPALVQIMAWRHSGNKPLSEPRVVNLPMHICVTRPQWVKGLELYKNKWELFPKETYLPGFCYCLLTMWWNNCKWRVVIFVVTKPLAFDNFYCKQSQFCWHHIIFSI